jgi:flavin reductase (DIM6/NTAB) family NADH-FMN oxidoreductase RutF
MIEAVNATSIDAPYGVSEWEVSGLHEAPSTTVKPSRVEESVFNIEGKVIDIKEFTDHQQPGMSLAATVLIKATRFWVKEGTADADYTHKAATNWTTWWCLLWPCCVNLRATTGQVG